MVTSGKKRLLAGWGELIFTESRLEYLASNDWEVLVGVPIKDVDGSSHTPYLDQLEAYSIPFWLDIEGDMGGLNADIYPDHLHDAPDGHPSQADYCDVHFATACDTYMDYPFLGWGWEVTRGGYLGWIYDNYCTGGRKISYFAAQYSLDGTNYDFYPSEPNGEWVSGMYPEEPVAWTLARCDEFIFEMYWQAGIPNISYIIEGMLKPAGVKYGFISIETPSYGTMYWGTPDVNEQYAATAYYGNALKSLVGPLDVVEPCANADAIDFEGTETMEQRCDRWSALNFTQPPPPPPPDIILTGEITTDVTLAGVV